MMLRENIDLLIQSALRERVFPGCVVGVLSQKGASEIVAAGRFTYHTSSPEVIPETVYDLASITKSIPTASLALLFIEKGKLRLTDYVRDYIPELQNDHDATIEDLLRYRVRGPRFSTLGFSTFEEIRTHVFEQGFDGPPGERAYTNMPSYVLGVVLERVGGASLAALAHHYFFKPLSMDRTTFFPSPSDCPPTEIQNSEVIQGIVHDESARMFARKRRTVGHAGLFSTVPDLMKFVEALFQGAYPEVLVGAREGLGWDVSEAGLITKTGFTGTSITIDPDRGRALLLLSNRTYPTRASDTGAIQAVRAELTRIVFG